MQIENMVVSFKPYILENGPRKKIPKGRLMIMQRWDPSGPNVRNGPKFGAEA